MNTAACGWLCNRKCLLPSGTDTAKRSEEILMLEIFYIACGTRSDSCCFGSLNFRQNGTLQRCVVNLTATLRRGRGTCKIYRRTTTKTNSQRMSRTVAIQMWRLVRNCPTRKERNLQRSNRRRSLCTTIVFGLKAFWLPHLYMFHFAAFSTLVPRVLHRISVAASWIFAESTLLFCWISCCSCAVTMLQLISGRIAGCRTELRSTGFSAKIWCWTEGA